MKKKIGVEDRIVFISNTLGSFVLAFYFIDSKSIIKSLLGIYFLFNMFCYLIVIRDLYKRNDK